ncbi:prepilin-type N-terminal cleavage/methylation domain-containing protein [Shewanella sp. SNU WT4]|uniref:GspH/FimT family pseudopilin n=1 Tax=Shewanella sp. SNU WT4 TaxID=2590015 RepID=UPI00112D2CBF|nr:GspH/FimT family pseudopilin [Shewanella sp. SNU WT4]QDF66365.1 prepilin-type N-terminal cleavage/methylation domain-containing protein [Shewanella sp. SNU WT4]
MIIRTYVGLGFTFIELMITIAIAAILLTIGTPSLVSLYEGMRVNSNIEKIHDTLIFARSQAISYGTTVKVCPYATADACGTTTDWSKGIRVYTDKNISKPLRAIDGFHANDKVKGSVALLTFAPDGLSNGATLTYCPNGKKTEAKAVTVKVGGIISYSDAGAGC